MIVVCVILIALTAGLVVSAGNSSVSAEEQAAVAERDRLAADRRALELGTLRVVTFRMLDGIGVDGDRTDRLSSAADDVRSTTADITTLARGEGTAAKEARALLAGSAVDALENPLDADLNELFAVAEDSARWGGASEVVETRHDAIQQLSFVSALPFHALIEGAAADVSVNERVVAPAVAPFVDTMIGVVRTEGGWFGTDPSAPLDDSVWIEIDGARELLPTATMSLNELVASSEIVVYDAWVRELRDGDTAPPFELVDMLAEADELQLELQTVIDELLADDEAARVREFVDRDADRRLLLAAALVTGTFAAAGLVLGSIRISRASRVARERSALAMRDALTGVGNRHELEAKTSFFTQNPRHSFHLVAMIDLDRFKMTNDVHGHAAGDAVLIEVATRLQQIVTRAEAERPGTKGSVTRLGGDEFLLTIHSAERLDADGIDVALDAIRTSSLEHHGEQIMLGFSVGIVVAEGPNELSDLMGAADLAVYDDKASRSQGPSRSTSNHAMPQ